MNEVSLKEVTKSVGFYKKSCPPRYNKCKINWSS